MSLIVNWTGPACCRHAASSADSLHPPPHSPQHHPGNHQIIIIIMTSDQWSLSSWPWPVITIITSCPGSRLAMPRMRGVWPRLNMLKAGSGFVNLVHLVMTIILIVIMMLMITCLLKGCKSRRRGRKSRCHLRPRCPDHRQGWGRHSPDDGDIDVDDEDSDNDNDDYLCQGGVPGLGEHGQAELHPVHGDDLLAHAVQAASHSPAMIMVSSSHYYVFSLMSLYINNMISWNVKWIMSLTWCTRSRLC